MYFFQDVWYKFIKCYVSDKTECVAKTLNIDVDLWMKRTCIPLTVACDLPSF